LESFTGTCGGEPNGTVVVIACGCSTGREEGAGEAGPEVPTCQGVDRLPELPVENTMLEVITRVAIAHVRPPRNEPVRGSISALKGIGRHASGA
jgi:hypothetical protein